MNHLTYHSNREAMNEQDKYEKARKRVEEEKGFYGHLIVYVLVMTFLIILNQLTSRHQWWYWPAIGWGIGVAAHAFGTFGVGFVLGRKWEEKRMRQLMSDDEDK